MGATPPQSPILASLWSHRSQGAKQAGPGAFFNALALVLLVAALSYEVNSVEGLFGSSNGRLVSFLKSVHMTNYCAPTP